jgi:hypothetical protein
MKAQKKVIALYVSVMIAALFSCSKGEPPTPGDDGNGGTGGGSKDTTCIISTISQVNSGSGTESSLSAFYNSNHELTRLIVYDSVNKVKTFEANFSYITTDSVQINQYQYFLLDGNRRVIRFVTRSDMKDPLSADHYRFEYTYNSEGYLAAKNLFINGAAKANFRTLYSYTANRLTGCIMTSPSAGDSKVLEATLSYDNSVNNKNWIYTFPDAMEGYQYTSLLNFGKRMSSPLTRVETKIYNPVSGTLLDTWTTNYKNYKINAHGYITSGEAMGDLQQGMAAFYGKTNFYYSCYE